MTEGRPDGRDKPDSPTQRAAGVVPEDRAAAGPAAAPSGAPRWFKVLAVVGAVFLLLVIALLLTGHGPSRHMHSSAAANAFHGSPTAGDSEHGECWPCG